MKYICDIQNINTLIWTDVLYTELIYKRHEALRLPIILKYIYIWDTEYVNTQN